MEWEEQFAGMRAQFLTRANERLARVAETIARLEKQPTDAKALADVRQHFHWLAGAGGTYQLPEVSNLGATGQELCDEFIETKRLPSVQEVQSLREMIDRVRVVIGFAK